MVDDNKHKGFAPPIFQKILRSNYFATFFHILVLVNAISAATLQYDHNKKTAAPSKKLDNIYKAEVIFLVFLVIVSVSIYTYIYKCVSFFSSLFLPFLPFLLINLYLSLFAFSDCLCLSIQHY